MGHKCVPSLRQNAFPYLFHCKVRKISVRWLFQTLIEKKISGTIFKNIKSNLFLTFLWMQMCWCYSVIWFNQMIGRFRDRDGSDSSSTPTDGAAPTPITNDDLDTMFDKTQRQIRYKISIISCLIFVAVHCSSILTGCDGFQWVLMGFDGFWWVLMGFNGFWWAVMGSDGFQWVLMGSDGCWWVLMGFDGF